MEDDPCKCCNLNFSKVQNVSNCSGFDCLSYQLKTTSTGEGN